MKKITRLLATVALLFGVVGGVKAERLNLSFETPEYCAASWNASTNTLTWGSGGWNSAWTFMAAKGISGDLSSWETLHLNAKNFTNSQQEELTVVFKKNDGTIPPSGPTKEFVVSPDANGDITIDLTNVVWGDCDITKIQDLTIYGGARTDNTIDASVVITDAYLEKPDPDTPQTKNPILLLKGGAINTTDFDITPISPSTLATDNLYAATFTSKANTKNAFQYKDLDVSTYEKIVIKYSIEDNSEWRICLPDGNFPALPTGTNKTYEINLSNISTYADFTIFSSWQNHTVGSSITISEVYYVESSDPYASERAELQAAIDLGNAQNSFAKTTASWKALQDAITAATAELTKTDATAESLTAAKEAITNAIAGFKLQDGYTFLTTDMYKRWNDNYNPTTSESTGCYYVLNESVDKVYGDGDNVYYLNFADISDFDKLYVLVKAGQARVQMNRETDNGTTHIAYRGDAVSVVDFATEKQEGGVLEGFDFVHLNAIKDNWGKVTVSDMLLYRTITVGNAGYATFGSLSKNAAMPEGVEAYGAYYNSSNGKLTPIKVKNNIPAGEGVILEATPGTYVPTFDVEATAIENNELKVSNGTVVGDGTTIYVLANTEQNGVGFYLLEEGNKVPAGKVYYKSTSNDARQFIGFDEGATAIKTVKGGEAENAIYNLAGQRLTKAQKGLNIVNGKVVLVK